MSRISTRFLIAPLIVLAFIGSPVKANAGVKTRFDDIWSLLDQMFGDAPINSKIWSTACEGATEMWSFSDRGYRPAVADQTHKQLVKLLKPFKKGFISVAEKKRLEEIKKETLSYEDNELRDRTLFIIRALQTLE